MESCVKNQEEDENGCKQAGHYCLDAVWWRGEEHIVQVIRVVGHLVEL